jgi:hypothetical protein
MTLEVRDVESVDIRAGAFVVALSLTRPPDDLEADLIPTWPVPPGANHALAIEDRLLVVRVPDQASATATVAWLMGDQGLAAMAARADVMRAAGDQLFDDLRALVHKKYDEG